MKCKLRDKAFKIRGYLDEYLIKLSDAEAAVGEAREEGLVELDAVMHSVDKWFDEGDKRLKLNPATRACDAREIALRAIEAAEAETESITAALSGVINSVSQERECLRNALEAAVEEALEQSAQSKLDAVHIELRDGNCGICGKLTSCLAANPGLWPVRLPYLQPTEDQLGKDGFYHTVCVMQRLRPAPTESAELIAVARELQKKALSDGPYKELLRELVAALERSEREVASLGKQLAASQTRISQEIETERHNTGKYYALKEEHAELQREVARLRKEQP